MLMVAWLKTNLRLLFHDAAHPIRRDARIRPSSPSYNPQHQISRPLLLIGVPTHIDAGSRRPRQPAAVSMVGGSHSV
jgi:hypothetical protein